MSDNDKMPVSVSVDNSSIGCYFVIIVVLILAFGPGFYRQITTPATCPTPIIVTATPGGAK